MPGNESGQTHFHWPVRIYIEDTDAGGIVYYVNYLKFMERARTEFMRSLGFEQKLDQSSIFQFVVHSANMSFVKPARMDMELLVSVELVKVARSYFILKQDVTEKTSGKLFCSADIKVACVNNETFKPQAMPDFVSLALNKTINQFN